MIKVQLEFHSVPEAIIALNAIMNLPEVKATSVAVVDKGRKGRADKGQKRGEYKPRVDQPSAPETTGASQPASGSESSPTSMPAPAAEVPVKEKAAAFDAVHAPVSATIGDKDLDAQKAMEALHGKKGLDACRVLLGQFGVSRIREIPTARRGEFLDQAAKAAA